MADGFGSDALVHQARDFKADAVLTMHDIWTINPTFLPQIKNFIPYVPIDKEPVPLSILERLEYAYKIITFSRFGQKALERAGFASTLIVEGIDVNLFTQMDKMAVRRELGLPQNAFIFGMIAANKENPPRKGWQEALEAFALFYKNHPEAMLFLRIQQQTPSGFPILGYARYLDIAHRLIFVEEYEAVYGSDITKIVKEMNAIDVLLHPSQTEGFGLTVVEAQACGTPVLVNDCTSMPELIIDGVTGEKSRVASRRFSNDLGYVYVANPNSIAEKMEILYKRIKEDKEGKIAKACRENIVKNYNIDTIFKEQWVKFYETLQDELLPIVDTQKKSDTIKTVVG